MFPRSVAEPRNKRQRAPHQLPAGRHGLARSFVVSNQRERIIDAVAAVTSQKGYVATSVEDLCAHAGVSRRTFYDHYKGKEDVFLAAFDEIARQLFARVLEAYEHADGLIARARDSLQAFLEFVASEPAFADMCIVEVLAAGPAAIDRRNRAIQGFAQLIQRAVDDEVPKRSRPPALIAETVVGGIYEVVYVRVVQGRTAELPDLLPDLLYSLLLPYLGHDRARAEYQKLRRRAQRR